MADIAPGQQLGAAVRASLAEAADYLAQVTRADPGGSADALLRRPDVKAVLADALDQAAQASEDLVRQHWGETGAAASDNETLEHLLDDIGLTFGKLAHLRALVRRAHAGAEPAGRADAVSAAVLNWGRQAALRARMTAAMAEGAGKASAAIARGRTREVYGERVMKRWRAHADEPTCCIWCRRLDGVTIPLNESFEPYLGGPVAVPQAQRRRVRTSEGERRYGMPAGSRIVYTHPPKPYRGKLQGPLLHPFCRCWLEIVRVNGLVVPSETDRGDGPLPVGFLSADDIRDMPEEEYQADRAFIQAAVYALDQVLKRLAGGGG